MYLVYELMDREVHAINRKSWWPLSNNDHYNLQIFYILGKKLSLKSQVVVCLIFILSASLSNRLVLIW